MKLIGHESMESTSNRRHLYLVACVRSLACVLVFSFFVSATLAVAAPTPQEGKKDSTEGKTVSVPATVKGIQTVDMFSKVGGFLKNMNVDIGDEFKAGDALAELDIPEMKSIVLQKKALVRQAEAEAEQAAAAVKQAEAQLVGYRAAIDESKSMRSAKDAMLQYESREFSRLSRMAQSSSIRQELVDTAQLKVQSARSEIETVTARVATAEANLIGAKASVDKAAADRVAAESRIAVAQANLQQTLEMMKYATIRAPWDGLVIHRHFDAGAFIQSADGNSGAKPLLRIAKVDTVRVTCALSNSDIEFLNKGDRAVLSRIAALKDQEFEGTVTRFSGGMDEKTRMMQVEVDLDNKDGKLRPGFFGYLKIFVGDTK